MSLIPSGRSQAGAPRNDLEALMDSHGLIFRATDDEIDQRFRNAGYAPESLPRLREEWDRIHNSIAAEFNGTIQTIGAKPAPGSTDFMVYDIPNSSNPRLAIRLFDGGLGTHGHWFFDWFDLDEEKPIITPPRYKTLPTTFTCQRDFRIPYAPLTSWEVNMGIPQGDDLVEERFSVPENTYWEVYKGRTKVLQFHVPTIPIPGFVEPREY